MSKKAEQVFRVFVNKAFLKSEKIQRAFILDLFSAVVLDTPVLTGLARGNWQTTIGSPAQGTRDLTDKTGAVVIAEISSVIGRGINDVDVVYFSNNLPYIAGLERGRSKKAPNGMVARNVEAANSHFDSIVSGVT